MGLARRGPELARCPGCGGDAWSVGGRGWCLARVDEGGCGSVFRLVRDPIVSSTGRIVVPDAAWWVRDDRSSPVIGVA